MLPISQSGSTQWSHAYTSPLNSIAMFAPHRGACAHTVGAPKSADSAESKSWTKTPPTSRGSHWSKTSHRNAP